jgi:UDP-N-acetylmuramate--alanine ligase
MNEKSKTKEELSSVYFIGIGGIGMSALARYYHSKGAKVSGYDKTQSSLTAEMEESGIGIHYEENVDLIPKDVDLVVYTPAIPEGQKELVYYRQHGFKVIKRSEVLQIITESSFNICIAGTHGKTTISTMIAHLLRHTGYGCNAFLGGISVNYGTNFWSQAPSDNSERNVCVVEADEYDRSFLKLSPDIAVISAMDADHLDIYGTAEEMEKAFIEFSAKVKTSGFLLSKFGLKRSGDLKTERHWTYGDKHADAYTENVKMINGSYEFDVVVKENKIRNVILHMGGMHNVENAVAAITVASSLGIDNEKIKAAIEDFKGVKRRFEYVIKTKDVVYVDDYAHHPEELRALIKGARSLFSERKCTVIFQPHLYSRTRDLADGFAESLDLADEVILLPIYPARELPVKGVSSELILDRMKNKSKRIMEKDDLIKWIRNDYAKTKNKDLGKILITAGAGDIDGMIEPIKEILAED